LGLTILGIKNMSNFGDGLKSKIKKDPFYLLENENNL